MFPPSIQRLIARGAVVSPPARLPSAPNYRPMNVRSRRPGRGVRPDNTVMNGAERAYAAHLELQKAAGEIFDWKFHAMTLTIAAPPNAKVARWTPDFCVWTNEMVLEFHDVKGGYTHDHAIVRIKAAAALYPHPVRIVKRRAKKAGGGFAITQV